MSNGKGDRNRQKSISYKEWSKRYEAIFKKDKKAKDEQKKVSLYQLPQTQKKL